MERTAHKFRLMIFVAFLFSYFIAQKITAQDSTATDFSSEIRITARVDKKQVPLNRTFKLTVRVEWSGNIERYQISELDDPVINNLEIISTSSADFRTVEGGVQKAARVYEFELKPKTLGMAYIEATMVTYVDVETGEGHTLKTNRIDVEVIESVPEPGEKKGVGYYLLFIGLPVLIAALVGEIVRRNLKKRKEVPEIVPEKSLEEQFLENIKTSLGPERVKTNISEGYYLLSRFARKYLKEKYEIDALELTTDEILKTLSDRDDIDDSMVQMIDEVLRTCDLAKFSGSQGDINEFQRLYTLFESILEKNQLKANGQANNSTNES